MSKKNLTTEIANINNWQFDGEIFNFSELTYEDINEMLHDDAVKSALTFRNSISLNFLGEYKNEDKKIEQFVRDNFENLQDTLSITIDDILKDYLGIGFSVSELVWEIKESKLYLKKINKLDPRDITIKIKNSKIDQFVQTTPQGKVDIPEEKIFYIKNGSGYYGHSELEAAKKWFLFKKYMMRYWMLGGQRYGVPPLIGKTKDNVSTFLNKLAALYSNGAMATGIDDEVKALEFKDSFNFQNAIDFANTSIYRSLLLPQLLVSVGQSGAYELGKIHFEMFLEIAKKTAIFTANKLIDKIVTKIIDYNFNNVKSYGSFIIKKQLTVDDLEKYSRVFQNLTNAGIIDPIEDNDIVREHMDLNKSSK
jgi:phage gp29-like protein